MDKQRFSEKKGYVTQEDLKDLPDTFGVYIMKDNKGHIIYIGKAKSLKKRVSSYFHKHHTDEKTRMLVENIKIIDYITVSNEMEALILEATLIKKHSPRYNVQFKDNKFYPFVKVTIKEKYPRIMLTRNHYKDGSLYFGPYTSARAVRRYIDIVQHLFKIRTCKELPNRECLNYHIHRCSAPCINKISEEEYAENVSKATLLLEGKITSLLEQLQDEMKNAAKKLEFELAHAIKEKIEDLKFFEESQSVFLPSKTNADFISFATHMGRILFVVVIIRQGKMIGKRSYSATLQLEEEPSEVLSRFVIEYYRMSDKKESRIFIEEQYSEIIPELEQYLKEVEHSDIDIKTPVDDDQKSLMRIARQNSSLHLSQVISRVDASESLGQLQSAIQIDRLPMRIEGFDIANLLGENAVASMVSFYAAKPDKKSYRHFKIKTKTAPDDFAMIREAVFRRYSRIKREAGEFPDLILIDGGKGQLNSALDALNELELDLNVISLAKKNEEIYIPGKKAPIVLSKNSPALHVLQRVRDESHRFANTFYNKLKHKSLLKSIFDDIDGIGEKRKNILLKQFTNSKDFSEITEEQLIAAGIPESIVENVYNKLKKIYN